jgi:hypothetical protein
LLTASCATGSSADDGSGGPPNDGTDGGGGGGGDGGRRSDATSTADADSCAQDQDHDGVPDCHDMCPNTAPNAPVNKEGCSDPQTTPKVEPMFPPYMLTWAPSGNLGRAGGLTWGYTGIQRGDLFHIYWVVCDDPATPCGLSLDGPIDQPGEKWQYDATDSNLSGGKLVFTNTTNIALASGMSTPLTGRLTLTIVDGAGSPVPWADVATLALPARDGKYGAEITGTGFMVKAIAEVQDMATSPWTPYLDYYDMAATPGMGDAGSVSDAAVMSDAGGSATTSFGGSFYDR